MQMPLDEFEMWAADRIHILSEIENCSMRAMNFKDTVLHMKPIFDKYMPLNIASGGALGLDRERTKDHFSHYILRLAFSRTPELRHKFVQLETMVFRIRFETDDSKDRSGFVESLNLDWERVPEAEKYDLFPYLKAASGNDITGNTIFYKVDFEKVIELVDQRRVFLRQGKAFVPESQQRSLIISEFSSRLMKGLEHTARLLPRLDEDDRLVPVLKHLADDLEMGAKGNDSDLSITNGEEIRADMIEQLDKQGHFPLCMSTMQKSIAANGHAKFETRREYGTFLKSIGVSVDESLKFWRKAFKKKSDDEFNKEYRYFFRHIYGLEGSRIKYRGMGCIELAKQTRVSRDEPHGCPYRLNSIDVLTRQLRGMGITDDQNLSQIKTFIDNKAYHRACSEVYDLTHPNDETKGQAITAPKEYFARSFACRKQKTESDM